jgi:LysR family hydrogen peroxide-inducible transcriptional activator
MTSSPVFNPRATSIPVLRYLVAVAEHLHFGRAAAACHVSQPTLSALITQWERRMRCTVFERSARGVRLTPAGAVVVAAARQALAAVFAVEEAALAAKPPFFGPVRLGVIPTVGPYALPFIVPALQRAFPDLELPIREGTTSTILTDLDAGRLDVALLAILPGMEDRYTVLGLYAEPFLAAVPRGHRLATGMDIDPEMLAAAGLLLLDEGHCLREQALEVCRQQSPTGIGADFRATSLETLRQIVASGGGVTLLPALATGEEDRRLVLRPVRGGPSRSIGLVWRSRDPRGEIYRRMADPIRRRIPRTQVRLL